MLKAVRRHFVDGQCYLFTFKSINPKHEINFVNRLCKKVSKTYIIVRERNKITEGYHYHAILKMSSLPPRKWYTKGIHMNLKRIGVSRRVKGLFSKKEVHDLASGCSENPEDLMGVVEDGLVDKVIADRGVDDVRAVHVDRTLNYLSKEMEMPAQYSDYIFSVRGKLVALATETGS